MRFGPTDQSESFDYEGIQPARGKQAAQIEDDPGAWDRLRRRPGNLAGSGEGEASQNPETDKVTPNKNWLIKRGHTLTYIGLFLFTVVLYWRPYEMLPAFSWATSLAFYIAVTTLVIFLVAQLATEGNITALPKEVIYVILFGVAALCSIPLAIDPGEAWLTFSEILVKALVMFIVLVNVVRTERRLNALLLLALSVSIYLSVNAISDYQNGIFVIGKADLARIGGSIGGLFKNSNDLALHLVTMVPIAVVLALATKGPLRKIVYMLIAGLMVAAIIVTFSRGGFLGLVGVMIVFAYKFGRKNRTVTTAVLAVAVVLFLALAPGEYSGRLSTIFDSASDLSGSSSQRTQVLKRSVVVALRYPLFGVGLGNFHYRSFQELGTHNAYTQVASEIGIPAAVIYVLFLLHSLKRLRQVERETFGKKDRRRLYFMSVGLQAALIGYMVSSFFGAVAYQWYVYYLVGYAVCLHRIFLAQTPSLAHVSWLKPFAKPKKGAELINPEQVANPG